MVIAKMNFVDAHFSVRFHGYTVKHVLKLSWHILLDDFMFDERSFFFSE